MDTTNIASPIILATATLTREVEVCEECGCTAGDCDHDAAIVTCRVWRPAVALGRIPVSAEDLTPAQVETVRAWVEGIRAERGWLTTTEERALASCDEDPAYCAEAYNALVRSGAVS